jgi:hypothetical protein
MLIIWELVGDEEIIAQLPSEWSEDAVARAPENAARYEALQRRLVDANERRRAAKEKIEGYRSMVKLVGAFGEEGRLQGNLVTKGGEVENELERMRMLMLRVERGLEGLEEREGGYAMDVDVDEDEDRNLKAILGT